MASLDPAEQPTQKFLFYWLFDRVRGWKQIASKIDLIQDSREGSSKRTFDYLWHVINEQLSNHYEHENYDSLAGALSSKSVGGAAAPASGTKGHTQKDSDADKTRGARSESVQAAAIAAKKGNPKCKKKGSGKSHGKGQGPNAKEPNTPRAKQQKDHTPTDTKTIACKFELLGTCTHGDSCRYSHDKRVLDAERQRRGITAPVVPAHAAVSPSSHTRNSHAKTRASSKSGSGVNASIATALAGASVVDAAVS